MSYKTFPNNPIGNVVQRLEDGVFIPQDPGNRDWIEYQAWLAQGNVPTPAVPTPLTPAQDLADTDQRMARVGEDVIALLISKNLIKLTDLPAASQAIIAQRQADRGKLPPGQTTQAQNVQGAQ